MSLTASNEQPSQGPIFPFNKLAAGTILAWGLEQLLAGTQGKHIHVSKVQVKKELVK